MSIRYPAPIFSVSAGLLLRDDIHHAFDRLELSFYLKVRLAPAPDTVWSSNVKLISQDGTYYLHFFVLLLQSARELHGKALTAGRFRGKLRDYPDPRFIKWHYNQCVKARIRGFASGTELSERWTTPGLDVDTDVHSIPKSTPTDPYLTPLLVMWIDLAMRCLGEGG